MEKKNRFSRFTKFRFVKAELKIIVIKANGLSLGFQT